MSVDNFYFEKGKVNHYVIEIEPQAKAVAVPSLYYLPIGTFLPIWFYILDFTCFGVCKTKTLFFDNTDTTMVHPVQPLQRYI